MRIAVIPARGGSKRIPRKNIRMFRGKPMIAWAIGVAASSKLFDHIMVSTDDREVADVARSAGAEVPFERPADLADDFTGTTPVIAHAIRWAVDAGWRLNAVCCVYPTTPFLLPDDLRRGIEALESGEWSYAMSVAEFPSPIFRAMKRAPEGGMEMFFPEHFPTRSQDLPKAYYDAGQMYWGTPQAWIEERRLFASHTVPVVLPKWRVQDIDTIDDWRRAEVMHDVLASLAASDDGGADR